MNIMIPHVSICLEYKLKINYCHYGKTSEKINAQKLPPFFVLMIDLKIQLALPDTKIVLQSTLIITYHDKRTKR